LRCDPKRPAVPGLAARVAPLRRRAKQPGAQRKHPERELKPHCATFAASLESPTALRTPSIAGDLVLQFVSA